MFVLVGCLTKSVGKTGDTHDLLGQKQGPVEAGEHFLLRGVVGAGGETTFLSSLAPSAVPQHLFNGL